MFRERGVTLPELLIAIVVAAILLAVGIPNLLHMMAENRRDTHVTTFYAALLLARSEAIRRNVDVVLCKSPDGVRCSDSGDFSGGWLVYANLDGGLAGVEPDAGDKLFDSNGALEGDFTLTSDESAKRVVFRPSGRARADDEFELCSGNVGIEGRVIEITTIGRPRISKEADCS